MNQAIATQPNGTTALDVQRGGLGIEGMEGIGQQDLILPRKTILQPMQKKEESYEHVGWFWDNLTEQAEKTLEAVVLRINRSGTKWTGSLEDKSPDCVSMDGLTGSKYGPCSSCPYNPEFDSALWQMPSDQAKSLRCNRGYLLLCADVNNDLDMFLLGISGTSVRPWKLFQTQLLNALRRSRKSSTVEMVIRFETEQKISETGKYFIIKPTIGGITPPEVAQNARDLARAMAGVKLADIPVDETESEGESVAAPRSQPAAGFDDGVPLPEEPAEAQAHRPHKVNSSLF